MYFKNRNEDLIFADGSPVKFNIIICDINTHRHMEILPHKNVYAYAGGYVALKNKCGKGPVEFSFVM